MRGGARAPKSTWKASSSEKEFDLFGSEARMRGERSALVGLGVVGLRSALCRNSLTDCDVMPRIVTAYCCAPGPPLRTPATGLACLLSTIVAWTTLTAGERLPRLPSKMSCEGWGESIFAAAVTDPASLTWSDWSVSLCACPSSQPGARRLRLPSPGSAVSNVACTRRPPGTAAIGEPASSTACTVAEVIGVPLSSHAGQARE
mmetsp:Transcript_32033/g.76293  ORF Transcript_32033/g.76293 Transcript_32033/m.76293 type:complete len:203 (-) Transcript_32033:64-672(-)|eukprot:scaffold29866_cov56-Phaeocystis_antarctica.AAC.4